MGEEGVGMSEISKEREGSQELGFPAAVELVPFCFEISLGIDLAN